MRNARVFYFESAFDNRFDVAAQWEEGTGKRAHTVSKKAASLGREGKTVERVLVLAFRWHLHEAKTRQVGHQDGWRGR
jgi:hypothetical protein